jgi:DNA-binding response OmpR family regulator
VLRKIRSSQEFAKVRVLGVTGLGPEAARHEATLPGVTKSLHKPLVPRQLVAAVRDELAEPHPKPDDW